MFCLVSAEEARADRSLRLRHHLQRSQERETNEHLGRSTKKKETEKGAGTIKPNELDVF